MGSACSRAATAADGTGTPRSPPTSPAVDGHTRIPPRTPALRTADGRLTPPSLLELCVQTVALQIAKSSTAPARLPAEVAARVVPRFA